MPTGLSHFVDSDSEDDEHHVSSGLSGNDTESHAPAHPSSKKPEGVLIKVEHIAIAIAIVVLLIYLGGASERGLIKMIESNALKKRRIPGSFYYGIMHLINALSGGLMGLLLNISLDDPFKGVPVVRENGKVHDAVFTNAPA